MFVWLIDVNTEYTNHYYHHTGFMKNDKYMEYEWAKYWKQVFFQSLWAFYSLLGLHGI